MRCCFEDCPDYSPLAGELDYCAACDREHLIGHLTTSVNEIDAAVEAVDWRFCVMALQAMAPHNSELQHVKCLFEQIESARNELKQLASVEQIRRVPPR
jgi:hypothetical protein